MVTCGAALQYVLAGRPAGGAAFVIGTTALVDHVADAGLRIVNNTEFATRADLVVVGAHEDFDFRELRIATQAVLRGAELIGVTRDPTFPMPDGPWPGTGAILAAVEPPPGAGPSGPSASPSPTCTPPPATGSGRGATWPSGTGSTRTWPARGGRAWTARWC